GANTVEVGIHDAGPAKNRPPADLDLPRAGETRSIDERAVADGDHGVDGIGPWRHRHADPHVVAENHCPRSAEHQLPVDPEVPAGREAIATEAEPHAAPQAFEDCAPFANRHTRLA